MDGRTQYGIVVAANVDDYMNERIRKHELTRRDKEEDRMKHVRINNANVEPVFLAFPDNEALEGIIKEVSAGEPEYDFTAPDGFGHHFWLVSDQAMIDRITAEFEKIPYLYIADGITALPPRLLWATRRHVRIRTIPAMRSIIISLRCASRPRI